MAQFVDDDFVAALEGRLQQHFAGSASLNVTGPGLSETDECLTVVTFMHNGKQHHTNIKFSVADRNVTEVTRDLIGQIVRWMQAAQQAA